MKHISSKQVELEEEMDGVCSRWIKGALESCGLWSSHGKGKPFMEMATEEGQTRGLKLGNEVVQGNTTKSEIEATLGKSKLVRVVEDRGVIRGLRQGKDECYQLVGRLREVWSELDVVKAHTSNPRCCQERRKQDVIFSFLMEEVCELVKHTCDVWEMNWKPERWKGGTSCKKGRLRKLSKEWLMKRRAWRKDSESEHLSDRMSVILKRIVGTKIRTVDFRLNKETKKTLVSQRTRISVNYHTSSNQNTRITTIKIRNRKESKVDLIPNLRMNVTTRTPYILAPRNLTFILPRGPSANHAVVHGLLVRKNRRMGLESCFSGKHGLSLLRSLGDSIRRFDENARTGVVSMFGKVQSLPSDRTLARARSLCSDRAKRVLGRYVATELRLELGRYVATERDDRSVAT
ncbi:hypothetical protein IGI04_043109 [Brassica rapa subsp. trilocularis]|uniref:Uncharacterized protein n=1 Tax=Brassica rapa subsp. trilocularis TaxID=1813537 RepID=A0ABQ7KK49_BRACM|nr:hypothetical protein IGI04_043109 [Brassica rapa subsp. trilocularis]